MDKGLLKALARLKGYRKQGWMNLAQIDEVIEILQDGYRIGQNEMMNKLMEEVVDYYTQSQMKERIFVSFVKNNMEDIAELLNRSKRTVYRKLQNGTFTLIEKRKIEEKMNAVDAIAY